MRRIWSVFCVYASRESCAAKVRSVCVYVLSCVRPALSVCARPESGARQRPHE